MHAELLNHLQVDGAGYSAARRNPLASSDRGTCCPLTEQSLPSAWRIILLLKSLFEVTTELHDPRHGVTLDPCLSFVRETWRLTVTCKRESLWREVSRSCKVETKQTHPKELPAKRCCCRPVPSQETRRGSPWLLLQCRFSGLDWVCSAPAPAVVLALKLVLANRAWCRAYPSPKEDGEVSTDAICTM